MTHIVSVGSGYGSAHIVYAGDDEGEAFAAYERQRSEIDESDAQVVLEWSRSGSPMARMDRRAPRR